MFVRPWSKEAENYFKRLAKDRIAYTKDTNFTRNFGKKYANLIDQDFLDIGRIGRKRESVIVLRPGVTLEPIKRRNSRLAFKFEKLF